MNDMDAKAEVEKLDATVKEEVKTLKEDIKRGHESTQEEVRRLDATFKELDKNTKRGHESIQEEVRRLREEVRQYPAPMNITGPVQLCRFPSVIQVLLVNNIESFTQAGIVNYPYGGPQLPQTVGNPDQEQAMGAEGYSEELQLNQQDPPTEEDIWNVILSFKESFLLFAKYLRYKLNLDVRWCDVGSLLTTVECSSLQSLEGLWEDYCSGHLNEIAQQVLVTTDVFGEAWSY
ncbi:hypothetical protein OS493_038818 [Desmophyllum pertusum]|uniref:TRADD-like N-terminal domain-containing protein n=1 Tax=Desmophyllum pertusum TaxID=174260 RepID=A0A9W9ZUU2_9CNID|nr:hypothetical protein OS493_038818 [Desmophyllum pertusum]